MRLTLGMEFMKVRSGRFARVPALKLCGSGADRAEAQDSLQRVAMIWARSLRRAGYLERAVARRDVDFDPDGEVLEVVLEPL